MVKQIVFKDLDDNGIHAGIKLDDGNVICGCCGGLFEADEENETWELIKEYEDWIDIEEAICGDDNDLLLLKG